MLWLGAEPCTLRRLNIVFTSNPCIFTWLGSRYIVMFLFRRSSRIFYRMTSTKEIEIEFIHHHSNLLCRNFHNTSKWISLLRSHTHTSAQFPVKRLIIRSARQSVGLQFITNFPLMEPISPVISPIDMVRSMHLHSHSLLLPIRRPAFHPSTNSPYREDCTPLKWGRQNAKRRDLFWSKTKQKND